MAYAKGEKPRDLDAACGGPTLLRVRSFLKDEDCGSLGPPNKQDYEVSGKDPKAKRTGDKSLPAVK
jgi:hypothetical protein